MSKLARLFGREGEPPQVDTSAPPVVVEDVHVTRGRTEVLRGVSLNVQSVTSSNDPCPRRSSA